MPPMEIRSRENPSYIIVYAFKVTQTILDPSRIRTNWQKDQVVQINKMLHSAY